MVTIQIPQQEAFRRGTSRYGAQPVDDFDAALVLLAEEERAALVVGADGALSVEMVLPPVSYDSSTLERWGVWATGTGAAEVAAGVRAALAECRQRIQARVAREIERVARSSAETARKVALQEIRRDAALAWAALPLGERASVACLLGLGPELGVDDLLASVPEALKEARGEIERLREVRDLAEAEVKARRQSALLAWAERHGSEDLRAAIRDGYPVGHGIEREATAKLLPPAPAGSSLQDLDESCDCGDRPVPSGAVRKIAKDLAAAVRAIPADLVPEGAEITVGRIRRLKWYEACGCGGEGYDCHDRDGEVEVKRTGVQVTISGPLAASAWYVVSE
jgi:hypothetical protein